MRDLVAALAALAVSVLCSAGILGLGCVRSIPTDEAPCPCGSGFVCCEDRCVPEGECTDGGADDTDAERCGRGVFAGDVTISSTQELADLEGYTVIAGDVNMTCTYCADLNPLYCLTSVEGDLRIDQSPSIASLEGLNNLVSVGGYFSIANTVSLTSLAGLEKLESAGELWIGDNAALADLTGLDSFTSAKGLSIDRNAELTSLNGAGSLASLGIYGLSLNENPVLTDLSAFGNVTQNQGGLDIGSNSSLAGLEGLGNITSVTCLEIRSNDALTSLDGLASLTSIDELIEVTNNPSLHDCEVCQLFNRLIAMPDDNVNVDENLEDSCTPVPHNCP